MKTPISTAQAHLQDARAQLSRLRQLRGLGDVSVDDKAIATALADLQLAQAAFDAAQHVVTPAPTSGMAAIGALLPPAAAMLRATADGKGFRRILPKLWASETHRFTPARPFDLEMWLKGFLSWAKGRGRGTGAVGWHFARPIIETLFDRAAAGKVKAGHAIETMEQIAKEAFCCIETVRKFVRDAEVAGWVNSWNRTARRPSGKHKGMILREANGYTPLMPEEDLAMARAAAPGSVEAILPHDESVPFAQRWLGRLARMIKMGERMFPGLAGRKIGLSLTPLKGKPKPA